MRTLVCLAALAAVVLAGCGPSDGNEGSCKDKLLAGDLVITEVFADYAAPTGGTGADEGKEWFEVFNASDRPIDLEGITVTHGRVEVGMTAPKTHVIGAITIAPGQYLTLGNSTRDLLPAYIDYGYSNELGELFNSNGGQLSMTCGDTVIDSTQYDAVKSGRSRQLTAAQPPDYTLNDDLASWCEAADTEFETNNYGTPGADNDCAPTVAGQCSDANGMRATVAPMAGQLVITELMPSPGVVSDTLGEWFEAKALGDFDLNGLGLDRAGDTAMPKVIDSPECLAVTNGQYVVFAKNADPTMNGGLPTPISGTFTFSMVTGSATTPGDIQILYNGAVIDAVTWTGSRSAKALQLDPDLTDATSNDSPSNFCDATSPYGADDPPNLGTPKAANLQCSTLPAAGMCDMGGGNLRAIVKPAANALQITEFLANPANNPGGTSQDTTREWFEITNTSGAAFDLNGLIVADANDMSPINVTSCISIAPGGFGLIARSGDTTQNGMLPTPDATFGFSLVDSGGKVEVRDGATVLDSIVWTSVSSGLARQLDPDAFTSFAGNNDAGTTASTQPWCAGTAPYGDATNKGTPKAANAPCP